jgi:hypothetical protein
VVKYNNLLLSLYFLTLANKGDLEDDEDDELDTPGSILMGLLAALEEDMPASSAKDLFLTGDDR